MKFTITIKDPDALPNAISDAVRIDVAKTGLDADERALVEDLRRGRVQTLCEKWFKYGEYFYIEVDTEAGTAIVLPAH